ncbi:MAG TPA: chemotaxis protein CheW, partial [Chloroflexia bacterium]|nr:chemotaxis protein CheW [Chloroflexia bacterium]
MTGLFDQFLDDYFSECDEHLVAVRRNLLVLEDAPPGRPVDQMLLDELLRSFHTLKGLSAMVGVTAAERLGHEVETYLRGLRQGDVTLTGSALDVLIAATHTMEAVVAGRKTGEPAPDIGPVLERLAVLGPADSDDDMPATAGRAPVSAGAVPALRPEQQAQLAAAVARGAPVAQVTFVPEPALADRGITVSTVRARLEAAGEVIAATPRVVQPGGLAFDFLIAGTLDPAGWDTDGLSYRPYAPPNTPEAPPAVDEAEAPRRSSTLPAGNVVRVDLGRLDALLRLVGDLVISRSRLAEQVSRLEAQLPAPEWRALEDLNTGLARQLRDLSQQVMRVRMVPVGDLFTRMQFAAHDLARTTGKQVHVAMVGQHTEVDKYVVERMLDPLLHMIRNAVSHGIEPPAVRQAAGKPAAGQLTLRAATDGDRVLIEIEDDGAGIDAAQVSRRARALGLGGTDPEADPQALLDILCTPGFSIREQADLASGRGVGMDVVRATLHELGGLLTLTSNAGHGTCFAVQLPLTLAIVDALIVGSGGQRYAVPLLAVREVIALPPAVTTLENNELMAHRGRALPLLRLSRLFHGVAPATRSNAMIVGTGAQAVAIAVDRILGKQEVVVRPLADRLAQAPGVAGASDLGDGRAVLILDVGALVQDARQRNGGTATGAVATVTTRRRPAAREQIMVDSAATAEPYILFEVAAATYAVRSRDVRQLDMIESITPLPNAPAFVDGVVFSRGQVIPAVNLRAR